MTPLLLDTCAMLWIAEDAKISASATKALQEAEASDSLIYVSPISAWEVGLLTARGRFALSMPPKDWFDAFIDTRSVALAPMLPGTLIDASYLPGAPPNDPADRIILATARASGMKIVTRDRVILSYAQQGHAWALEC